MRTLSHKLSRLTGLTAVAAHLARLSLALLAMLEPMRAESQAVSYTITDLTPAGIESVAYGINASGQIVGYYRDSFLTHRRAFLISDGALTDLGTLGGNTSEAYGINDFGHVVGKASLPGDTTSPFSTCVSCRPFLFTDGEMVEVGTLGDNSNANAINAWGQIAGRVGVRVELIPGYFLSVGHAFLYSDGAMTDLGTFGGLESNALGINSAGHVVGYSQTPFGQYRAFLYSDGAMTSLGTLGGFGSQAWGINDAGQIVGDSFTEVPFTNHAFLYSDGVMFDLGTLGGGRNSKAYAINNLGQIVGSSDTFSGGQRAFLYSAGEMIDLNTFVSPGSGWLVLRTARAINDAGQIVGEGITATGLIKAFLATPINPIPSITALSVSPEPPQSFGTPLTWTATATGGTPPLQYRFWRYNSATGAQTLVQDYSTSSTHTWTSGSTDIGNYRIIVWVRSAGSAAAYDAWFLGPTFTINP